MRFNDKKRFATWQAAMPVFGMQAVKKSPAIQDYLDFYGLDFSEGNEQIEHFLGFYPVEGMQIFTQYFRQKTVDDCVVVIHGYTDHAGLFRRIIEKLLNEGRSVFVFDFPGHGLSSGNRSDIDSFDTYQKVLVAMLQQRFQVHVPSYNTLHVVAQSMGAAVFMTWLICDKKEEKLGTIILLAPLVRPLAWSQAVWGYRLLSPFVASIRRAYSRNSQDESFLRLVRYEDPPQIDRMPVKWVGAMLRWSKAFEMLPCSKLPVWVIQGTHDETVDWQYNVDHLAKKFPNAQFRYLENAGHHLANEAKPIREKMFAFFDEAFRSEAKAEEIEK